MNTVAPAYFSQSCMSKTLLDLQLPLPLFFCLWKNAFPPRLLPSPFLSCEKEAEASDRNVCQKNGRFRLTKSGSVFSLIKADCYFMFCFFFSSDFNSNGYNGLLWKGQLKNVLWREHSIKVVLVCLNRGRGGWGWVGVYSVSQPHFSSPLFHQKWRN